MRRVLMLALLFAAVPATAAKWTVDPANSSIGFTATWLGKPVPGQFKRWTAAIDFDPAKPEAASIAVDIDTRSVFTGDKTVDGSLPADDWFDTARVTAARFVSTAVAAAGPGRYIARGTLTVKGKSVPVTLPFSLTITGDKAAVSGALTLDRRSFGLGLAADSTAEYVAFAVPMKISVSAHRAR